MVSAIFEGLTKFLIGIVNIMLAPINAVVSEFFPNLNDMVTDFYNICDTYIVPFINYGFHLLPTNSMRFLILYLLLIISFYTITLAAHAIIKVVEIIKNVKIW